MQHIHGSRPLPRQILLCCMLLMAVVFSGACGGKKGSEAERPPVLEPLSGQTPQQPDQATSRAPVQDALAGLAREAKGDPATAAPESVEKNATPSVRAQLLASAGRADGQQPEAGFLLTVPDRVWAGDPFILEAGGQGLSKLSVSWRGKTVNVQPGVNGQPADAAVLMLSVLLGQKEKELPISISMTWDSGRVDTMQATIPVGKRKRPEQRLNVAPKYVNPPVEMEEKIKQDQREVRETIAKVTPVRKWETPFLRPVPGVVTSLYGLRRVYNGEPRSPHRAIDFDAKEGDPIQVIADGTVVVVNEHYYGGNTVIVDHGLGVYSLYLHMSAFAVQPGQEVKRGDVLGAIGSTGRVTGPHLHLGLAVQGEMVDPSPYTKGMGIK